MMTTIDTLFGERPRVRRGDGLSEGRAESIASALADELGTSFARGRDLLRDLWDVAESMTASGVPADEIGMRLAQMSDWRC